MGKTGKLCALVILACILGPIATGYLLPAGTTEHTGYEQGNPVNVTANLYNNTEPYDAVYTGFGNNAYMFPVQKGAAYIPQDYVDAGSSAGPIRTYAATPSSTVTLATGSPGINYTIPSSMFDLNANRRLWIDWDNEAYLGVTSSRILVDGTVIDEVTHTGIVYQGGQYVQIGNTYYPISSTITLTRAAGGGSVVAYYFNATGWASDVAGQYVPKEITESGPSGNTIYYGAEWVNYKDDVAADLILRDGGSGYTITMVPRITLTMEDSQYNTTRGVMQTTNLTVTRSGAAVTATFTYNTWDEEGATAHTVTKSIGNYRDVLIRFSMTEDGGLNCSVSGLSYSAGISTDYESRIMNLYDLGTVPQHQADYEYVSGGEPYDVLYSLDDHFDGFDLWASAAHTAIMYWAAATYHAGSYSVIVDNTLTLTDYFPGVTSSAELRSISQYGTAIDLPNNANLQVEEGKITITGLDGEQYTLPVRNLTLLAIWNGTAYDCYVDDIAIGTSAAPAIGLQGAWLLTAYVFKTTPYTYTTNDWIAGSFNLDYSGFCVVGLLFSFFSFIVAGLWGRKSGSKVLSLMIITGICGFVYFNMLLEA